MASEDFTALSKLVVGLGRKKLGEFGGREKQGKIRGMENGSQLQWYTVAC